MFAITINQGGLLAGLINQDQLDMPEGTPHRLINENDFTTVEDLADFIASLSQEYKDSEIKWRYRVGSHSVDVEKLTNLLAERNIALCSIEASQLQDN